MSGLTLTKASFVSSLETRSARHEAAELWDWVETSRKYGYNLEITETLVKQSVDITALIRDLKEDIADRVLLLSDREKYLQKIAEMLHLHLNDTTVESKSSQMLADTSSAVSGQMPDDTSSTVAGQILSGQMLGLSLSDDALDAGTRLHEDGDSHVPQSVDSIESLEPIKRKGDGIPPKKRRKTQERSSFSVSKKEASVGTSLISAAPVLSLAKTDSSSKAQLSSATALMTSGASHSGDSSAKLKDAISQVTDSGWLKAQKLTKLELKLNACEYAYKCKGTKQKRKITMKVRAHGGGPAVGSCLLPMPQANRNYVRGTRQCKIEDESDIWYWYRDFGEDLSGNRLLLRTPVALFFMDKKYNFQYNFTAKSLDIVWPLNQVTFKVNQLLRAVFKQVNGLFSDEKLPEQFDYESKHNATFARFNDETPTEYGTIDNVTLRVRVFSMDCSKPTPLLKLSVPMHENLDKSKLFAMIETQSHVDLSDSKLVFNWISRMRRFNPPIDSMKWATTDWMECTPVIEVIEEPNEVLRFLELSIDFRMSPQPSKEVYCERCHVSMRSELTEACAKCGTKTEAMERSAMVCEYAHYSVLYDCIDFFPIANVPTDTTERYQLILNRVFAAATVAGGAELKRWVQGNSQCIYLQTGELPQLTAENCGGSNLHLEVSMLKEVADKYF